jgi:hypothetical protein
LTEREDNKLTKPKKGKNKMKKLMLFAAVTAIAGGAFAAEYVYDFTATLKTTKGRTGKETSTINLGADASGTVFWYQDPSVQAYLDATHVVGGENVPTISAANMATNTAAQAAVKALAAAKTYNYKSAGQWCATWKFVDQDCYRVAGSVKLTDTFSQVDCCADSNYSLTNEVGSTITYQETATAIGTPLFQRFGGLTLAKAKKVELYAPVVLKAQGATNVVDVFSGWLAGQGTVATKNNADYVSALSGNIVGTLPAPTCPNCCRAPTPAIAFDCANLDVGAQLPYTAGYGSFRLKINNKKSTF